MPFDFSDQIPDVQPGSIVSRKLVAEPDRRVVAFAFAAGEELTEHTTPFEARLEIHSGTIRVTVDGSPTEAGPGDTVPLPAGIPHAVQALTDTRFVLFMQR